MESQVRSLGVAIRNGHDAISMTQTAEGALGEMENILQRVRELAVQAGNSTLSASDRSAIQSEITQLTSEIDDIASSTHFNDVKILDGTVNSLDFQIGINASDSLNVALQNSSADSLGLNSGVGVSNLYTSERMTSAKVDASTNPAVSDIKINGQNFASAVIGDLSSSTETAGKVAEAINKNTSVHGAVANAFNTLSSVVIGGDFRMSDAFELQGETITVQNSRADLVAEINLKADGITAVLNSDTSITLSNTDGGAIVVADAAGQGAADVGFTTTGTFEGYITLENLDGSAVVVEAGNQANGYVSTDTAAGLLSDLRTLGLNQTTKDGAGVVSGVTTSITDLTKANALKLLRTDNVQINGVYINGSVNDSAGSKADAINALTAEHGVTATASTKVAMDLDFGVTSPTATEFTLNGVILDVSADTNSQEVADAINTKVGLEYLNATVSSTGLLQIVDNNGGNIVVDSDATNFVRSLEDGADNVLTAASTIFTAFGQLTLKSSTGVIKLEDDTATHVGLGKLGLSASKENTDTSAGGVDVTSLANATSSLAQIDNAISKVTEFRSSFGAVENRIDAKINNLTTLKVNTQAAQSRIEDADFAAETTNMTKSQILSQAATSMLAQANSSKQNLLALLQG
jgi:flagellin